MTVIAAPALAVQWDTSGNAGTDDTTDFLGTTDGEALVIKVNDVHAGRFEPAGTPRTIFGFEGNDQTSGIGGALVGGGLSGTPNTVTDNFGVIVGGRGNQAGDAAGTVIDASFATVVGGFGNKATGQLSTVLGGQLNQANGDASLAAGQAAIADHDGAIVFADASTTDAFASDRDNQIKLRGSGGFQINNTDGRVFEITPAASTVNIIAGHPDNAVLGGEGNVIVGGGDDTFAANKQTICGGGSSCGFNAIGGGLGNDICEGGGGCFFNTISGGQLNDICAFIGGGGCGYSTISGGDNNDICAGGTACGWSTISGGQENDICDGGGGCDRSTISGGQFNDICLGGSGCDYSTISGGVDNDICDGGSTCIYGAIGGGGENDICEGGTTCLWGTIGGGQSNDICAGGSFCDASTIGGGQANDICKDAGGCGWSTIGGGSGNQITADYATIPGGKEAKASNYGQSAYAAGQFADAGDAQSSRYIMRQDTVGATPEDMFLDGAAERLVIRDGQTSTFTIHLSARSNTGESAGYKFEGVIANVGGATTLLFVTSPATATLFEHDAAWIPTVTADDATDSLNINVTGDPTDNVRWVAVIDASEVVDLQP